MTARSKNPTAIARTAKREDTAPKKKTGTSNGSIAQARKCKDTSTDAAAATVDPNKPLTDKQKLFVGFWAQGESIHTASAKAGYADGAQFAYRMIRMPNVIRLYEELRARYEEASGMTFKKVSDMHVEAYEMAKLMAEPSTMVAAARELGKMHGYYAPVEQKITVTGNKLLDRINSMNEQELLKMVGESPTELISFATGDDETEDQT